MTTHSLFDSVQLGALALRNRIAMAPLTRNRAPGAVPTPLMATYYGQRASAGLIISEGVPVSRQIKSLHHKQTAIGGKMEFRHRQSGAFGGGHAKEFIGRQLRIIRSP